jgi:2-polyprenyl-3-methyl-5-hydroxy-6-metoxy-1,4-benzoquinol methylase
VTGKRPFVVRLVRALWWLASDRDYRNMTWLRLTRPKGVFQPNNDTADDRYPEIFRFVQSELGADSAVKILSFGCSTGAEVFSLRRYFPRATIKGIDINRLNVASARRQLRGAPDKAITFETAGSSAGEPSTFYDAIFCLAVLRHGALAEPGITRCDQLIRFEDFAAAVADFSRCLKLGGLLAIRHSNFRLHDAPAGAGFETILKVEIPRPDRLPLFGSDNHLLSGVAYPDTVFRKKRAD